MTKSGWCPRRQVLDFAVYYDQTMENLSIEMQELRAFASQKAAQVAELRVTVDQLNKRTKRAEFLLENVYHSWTWRVGRIILFPASIVRRVRNRRAGLKV